MSSLSDLEMSLFDDPPSEKPAAASEPDEFFDDAPEEDAEQAHYDAQQKAGYVPALEVFPSGLVTTGRAEPVPVLPPDAPKSDAATPAPVKRTRRTNAQIAADAAKVNAPTCPACLKHLNKANASQLSDGSWKHIGCSETQTGTIPAAPAAESAPAAKAQAAELVGKLLTLAEDRKQGPSQVIVLELGPKAAAAIEALTKALSK